MSKKTYEANWDTFNPTMQKKLLIQWAKQPALMPNEQLLFALEKVIQSKDDDLNQQYFDYLDKCIFQDKNHGQHFIKFIPYNDAIISFVLTALSKDILKNFRHIMVLRQKFSSVLLESGHLLDSAKKLFIEIDQSVLSYIVEFSFSDKTSPLDFYNYLYLVVSDQLFDPNKQNLDRLFNDKSHHKHLLEFFQYIKKPAVQKKLKNTDFNYDDIKELFAPYLDSLKYSRENLERASVENELFIVIVNLFYSDINLQRSFIQNIQLVLKNIIKYPDPNKKDELQKHFDHISNLDNHILSAFVTYLFTSDPDLGVKLFKKMDKNCKLLKEFSKYTQKNQPEQEELHDNSAEDQIASVDESTSESVREELSSGDEAIKEIKLGYFDAEGWEVKRSLLTPTIIFKTSDEAPTELLNALDKLAVHARKQLGNKKTSQRAKEGQQKYQELENLFGELSHIKANSTEDALVQARDILRHHLDQDPKDSVLLKNRRGFFGAYKTFSQLYSKLGLLHYHYTTTEGVKRTAESTTDHLLMELLDSIDEPLESVSQSLEN